MACLISGIPVTLYERVQSGSDPLGGPVFKEQKTVVEDVLVSPVSNDDLVNAHTLYGKKAVYTLAIPKGDTHNWQDAKVEFFGQIWKAFGPVIEGIEDNIPLRWNKKVQVEAYGNH